MAVDFRQRSLSELFRMVWGRKLAILLPTLAVTIAVWYVVGKLPSIYESKALLSIRPPAISATVIQPLSTEDVSQRLNAITEMVKSRSSLEPMVTKYNLFQAERAAGVPMELLIERMRGNIKVQMKEKTGDDKVPAFEISYRDREPSATRAVTQELAGKYGIAQNENVVQDARTTQEFIEKQLAEAKANLDQIDQQRLGYMLQNVDKLPTSASSLIAQLQGLREQEKTLSTEIGRMSDNRQYLERQKVAIRDVGDREAAERERVLSDPKRTPAYGELVKRRADLKAELQNLMTQYKPKHPEVINKQNQIDANDKEIQRLDETAKTNVEEVRQASKGRMDLQIQSIENEQKRIESEIARQQGILSQVQVQIGDLQRRIDSVPNAEVALEGFSREYQTRKATYDELLRKSNEFKLQFERDKSLQGEQIRLVDPANMPQVPVAPKRPLLIGLGALVGLVIGFLLAALLEFPRLLTIQNLDDAKHYTGLPVLASVPELYTPREQRWRTTFGFARAAIGIAIAVASVPLLIVALQLTRVFDRFVS